MPQVDTKEGWNHRHSKVGEIEKSLKEGLKGRVIRLRRKRRTQSRTQGKSGTISKLRRKKEVLTCTEKGRTKGKGGKGREKENNPRKDTRKGW